MSQTIYPPTVQGDVAHDAVDSGQPVKIGGKANTSIPSAVAAGDRVDAWAGSTGQLVVTFGTNQTAADGISAANIQRARAVSGTDGLLAVAGWVFNGTTWDRIRGSTLGLDVSRAAAAATATLTNVASSASNVTLLALNAARKGATIYNDSAAVLYVKFGATASSTSFTVKMAADAYYEVPFGYTGILDGIWASADGAARVTELT